MSDESDTWIERDQMDVFNSCLQYADSLWPEEWDLQIEADLESGRLDNLIAKAEADIVANQVRDLDEVLENS